MITLSWPTSNGDEKVAGPGVLKTLDQMGPLKTGVRLKLILNESYGCRCLLKEIGVANSGQAAAAMCRLYGLDNDIVVQIIR